MKQSTIWYILLGAGILYLIYWLWQNGYFDFLTGSTDRQATAVPCCVKRDANCMCTEYVYKKSAECETVPCPGLNFFVQNPVARTSDTHWVVTEPTAQAMQQMAGMR